MTQSHLEPADIAADELLTVLQARKTAGDFTDLLSDISDIIGEVSGRTIAADNLIIAKRDVPLTYIGDLDENLNVSVMAGPEGVRELNTDSSCLEEFTVDVAIELHMDRGNSLANPLMRQLGRKVSDWIMFTDGDADRRQRRRLTTIDSLVKRHQDVAKYDPLELLNNSVFLSLKRFTFDAVT
tara:strand:- start:9200 stop:9748 length:549 start_codon:yes stop_codon:yes gene_type:complete